jgi:rhamnosyl/mannosyltransferase
MKILQIGKYSKEFSGGMENTIFSLSEQLAKKHEVKVITNNPKKIERIKYLSKVEYHDLPAWKIFSTPITPSLVYNLKKSEQDIIQISHPNPFASLAYLIAKPKGKLVVWYHYDIIKQRFLNFFYQPLLDRFLKKASVIVATSDNYARTSKVLRRFRKKVVIIPHGIDFLEFEDKKYKDDAEKIKKELNSKIVLFVGRLVYYKGIEYLIKAMRYVDAKLLIIGKGPLESKLKSLVNELNLKDRVIFQKVPSEESLARYYHACDVFVLPSIYRSEAFGVVLLEAMACGKPVITTEIGSGNSFICQHNINGFVIPPKKSRVLSIAINDVLSNKRLAEQFGNNSRSILKQRFRIQKMTDSFEGLYKRLK